MKAVKITLLAIDFDDMGPEGIKEVIENSNYPNDCIYPEVKNVEVADIGEWSDEHPLNSSSEASEIEYNRLFSN